MRVFTTEELVTAKPRPDAFKTLPRIPISILLDNVRSLQNVGLFFRLCDGFRVQKLYLTGITGTPPFLPEKETRRPGVVEHSRHEIEKTAIQTVPFVPWEYHEHATDIIQREQTNGTTVVSVELMNESVPYTTVSWTFPLLLVFGHERTGVTQEVLEISDRVTFIPMFGMGNSHNVAISAGIILSRAFEALPHPLAPTDPLGK